MRRQRRTKVVATLGPASGDRAVIARLFQAGADVFRINMSHTNHDRMRELVTSIRAVEAENNRPIGILVDLQGPKLRLGTFKDGAAEIDKGQEFVLDPDPAPGDATRVQLPHPEIFAAIKPGDSLLIDDGKLRLVATEVAAQRIVTQVEVGGKVSNRKGVSLPDTVIPLAALTPKDIADLEAALDAGIDWIALSFIQRPEDIAEAKKITRGRAAVMAKIEKPQAVARLSDILELADALMVARGDLGVEMPLEKVPGVQKEMTRACRRAGKPVVVATQMLESMIASPVPTRAEVSDVATAIFDGADAVMLSAESASGQYPVEAVATMNRIAEEVEDDSDVSAVSPHAADTSRNAPAPTLSPQRRGKWARRSTSRPSSAGPSPARPACGFRASGRNARSSPSRRWKARDGNYRWSGASIASSTRTRRIRTTWWSAPAASPSRSASPKPASASLSSPACRSAPQARPISCVSLMWGTVRPANDQAPRAIKASTSTTTLSAAA